MLEENVNRVVQTVSRAKLKDGRFMAENFWGFRNGVRCGRIRARARGVGGVKRGEWREGRGAHRLALLTTLVWLSCYVCGTGGHAQYPLLRRLPSRLPDQMAERRALTPAPLPAFPRYPCACTRVCSTA